MRAFRSELLKFRRWSVLAGSGVMILSTAFIAYLTFHQIASGATGSEITPLIQAFPTPQGLITVVGQARLFIIVIALIMVTSNIAAEWPREPCATCWCASRDGCPACGQDACAVALRDHFCRADPGGNVRAHPRRSARSGDLDGCLASSMDCALLAFFGNEVLCLVGISLLGMLIAVLARSVGAAVGSSLAWSCPGGSDCHGVAEGSSGSPSVSSTFCRARPSPRRSPPLPRATRLLFCGLVTVFVVEFRGFPRRYPLRGRCDAAVDGRLCRGKRRGVPASGINA